MTGMRTAGAASAPAPPTAAAPPRVVVAVATFRRPGLLDRALPGLVAQAGAVGGLARARVLVVDNDPAGSAREVVARHGVTYVHEPAPGIAAARNAALRAAAGADALVFIDDDEVPTDGWLAALVGSWRSWGCAAVAGPARRTFDAPLSGWVRASAFFRRVSHPTGTVVAGAATNNLLLDLHVLRAAGLAFDDRFGLTGGSDTLLTRTLTRDGHRIRWCDTAEVLDPVPADRATRGWVLRRAFRTGTTWSRVHVALCADGRAARRRRTLGRRLELSARAFGKVGRCAPAVLARRATAPARQVEIASAAGMLLGAWGYAFQEYRRSP